ncbi:MAG: transcriptional regulator [Pedosphaera sp.]|nr:transcriptional regulator [Pedosphaera sp.]
MVSAKKIIVDKPASKAAAKPESKPESSFVVKPTSKPDHKRKFVGSATTDSILGRPMARISKQDARIARPLVKVKPEWQKFYDNLLDLRERLQGQMSGLAKESQSVMESYSLHMGDSGTDNFDRDFALSLLSSDQDAVYEIDQAIKRIEKETYGICELTQKAIPRARLEAIPWARFTVEAQGQLEKEGVLRQRNRLGSLGTVEAGGSVDVSDDDDDAEEKPVTKEKE